MALHQQHHWSAFVDDLGDSATAAYPGWRFVDMLRHESFKSKNTVFECVGCGATVTFAAWRILERHFVQKDITPPDLNYKCNCRGGNEGTKSLNYQGIS